MKHWNSLKTSSIKKRFSGIFAQPFLWLIKSYRYFISPVLPASCRYYPSCSEYSYESIKKHGLCIGLWFSIKRIASCHPWSKGGYDPVPDCSHQHTTNKAHRNG